MKPHIHLRTSDPPVGEQTSVLVRRVLASLPARDVRISQLLVWFGRRSFGGLLVMLAALGLLPGIAVIAGLFIVVVGLQMLAGFRSPLFPKFVRGRTVDVNLVRAIGGRCLTFIEGLEKFVKPRWLSMTVPPIPNLVGAVVMALGTVIMMPLPFSNVLPAVALSILSVGQLERDGLMITVGLGAAVVALAMGVFIGYLAFGSVMFLLGR